VGAQFLSYAVTIIKGDSGARGEKRCRAVEEA
jgi:hypothetical protein